MVNIIKTMNIRIMTKEEEGSIEYLNDILDDFNAISSYRRCRREMTIKGVAYKINRYIVDIEAIESSDYLTLIEKLGESKKYHYTIFER